MSATLVAPIVCTVGALLTWSSHVHVWEWTLLVAGAPLLVFLVLSFIGSRPAVAVGGVLGQALYALEWLASEVRYGDLGSDDALYAAGTIALLTGCALAVRNSPGLRRSAPVRWNR